MSENQQANERAQKPQRKGLVSLVIAGVLIVLLVVLVVLWTTSEEALEPQRRSVPAPDVTDTTTPPQARPQIEPEPDVVVPDEQSIVPDTITDEGEPSLPVRQLPSLDQSTEVVVGEAEERAINTRPVRSEHLIRDLVVFLHNLSDGAVIRESATISPPDARFSTQTVDNQLYIDERTYARYDEVVEWFGGLDSQTVVAMYRDFEPLFEQAFGEIAHPDESFEEQLLSAIDMLLATPEPDGLLALSDDQVMYTFADPELEQLPAAQKQMLRLGLENQRRVKRKLREIRAVLQDEMDEQLRSQ